MTCAQVMYPYSTYFPYQRSVVASAAAGSPSTSAGTPTIGIQSSAETVEQQKKYISTKITAESLGSDGSPDCNVSSLSPASLPAQGKPESTSKEKNMHFVSSNCVVFTYYTGDISAVVDEHFSRALSQPSSYSPEPSTTKNAPVKEAPPMSQRNFPPSFWNSNYQPAATGLSALGAMTSATHNEVPYPAEAYHTGALHSIHQGDPWHYTLSSHAQATGHYTHRPTVHELSYSGMPSSRFSPQYSSLLLQPSVRTTRLPPCGALDKGDAWATSRYHEPLSHVDANYAPTYGAMGAIPGLEGQVQEPSKDLYWF